MTSDTVEVNRLRKRVEDLEKRIAALEKNSHPPINLRASIIAILEESPDMTIKVIGGSKDPAEKKSEKTSGHPPGDPG